jgi:hypothetical protein
VYVRREEFQFDPELLIDLQSDDVLGKCVYGRSVPTSCNYQCGSGTARTCADVRKIAH